MNGIFPFGYEPATAWYLVLYLATLFLHMVLMSYVIAGSFWLVVARMRTWISTEHREATQTPITSVDILSDWMPFALGGAITAGVAPLLFVQILYQEQFYTANLLLFHRWMSILPVLIVGFYLLYIQKAQWSATKKKTGSVRRLSLTTHVLVSVVAIACFGFVGYSWTENHLLGNQSNDVWSRFYGERCLFYFDGQIIPRLGIWFCGTFPTMLLILAGQRWWMHERESANPDELTADEAVRKNNSLDMGQPDQTIMSWVGMVALAFVWIFVVWYSWGLTEQEQAAAFAAGVLPYWAVAVLGSVIQMGGWWRFKDQPMVDLRWIIIMGVGLVLMMIGGLVLRELLRVSHVELEQWQLSHQKSAAVGGIYVFFVFLFLNIGVVIWCLRGVVKSKT